MTSGIPPQLFFLVSLGFVVGLGIFVRGLMSYRQGARLGSIATSSTLGMAAGEVRLTGTVEALGITLVSPLQSTPAVWYRSRIVESGRNEIEVFREERSVEFALRDRTGFVRVIPREARWEIPTTFHESTDLMGDPPPALDRRVGPSSAVAPDDDREAAVARLLTVQPIPTADPGDPGDTGDAGIPVLGTISGGRRYEESRLEPGQVITVVGFALPFGALPGQPDAETVFDSPASLDPTLAAELAEARAAGQLASSAQEAWGNAAIPGFGIGQPTETPVLDADARPLPMADAAQVVRAERLFEIPADELVVSSAPGTGLMVCLGRPEEVTAAHDRSFLVGMGGAAVATLSVLALALMIRGAV